jgi:hypothetical protein
VQGARLRAIFLSSLSSRAKGDDDENNHDKSGSDNFMIISVFLSLRRRRKRLLFFPSRIFLLSFSLSLSLSLFLFDVGAHERNRHSIQAMMRNNGYVYLMRQM